MPFKPGNIPYNKGKSPSAESRLKRSIAMKGHYVSNETKQKLRLANLGKKQSKESILKMAESKKGKPSWNKGKKMSMEQRHLLSEIKTKNPPRNMLGKKHSPSSKEKSSETKRSVSHVLKKKDIWYGSVVHYDDTQYCEKFNRDFKERVRAYWDYTCFECGTPQNGKKLGVHHIHYDKKMCCNGSPQDCVPLCVTCHAKTNHNRQYWEDRLTKRLYANNPLGKCFFTKKEMQSCGGVS